MKQRPDKNDNVAVILTCESVGRICAEKSSVGYRSSTFNSQEEAGAIRKELWDKEQKRNNYLVKSKFVSEKLNNITEPRFIL
ncbi:hypothetical protein MBANPS3_004730 [Mucor bainieri]